MIKYKQLRWSDCFSYGADNVIDLDSAQIVQLVGKNGHGKSSIALILEEVLFNKNSKNIKKTGILNRHSSSKVYKIELDFDKDGILYTIKTSRGATQQVSLMRDGEDISSHTATATLKEIQKLIGYDHATFSQIVYQSSVSSLEFLTATDTARKKFLIELLKLDKYTNALEIMKEEASKISKDVTARAAQQQQVISWLTKYNKPELLETKELVEVPEDPQSEQTKLAEITVALRDLIANNKRIEQNNRYKELMEGIQLYPLHLSQSNPKLLQTYKDQLNAIDAEVKLISAQSVKLVAAKDKCPTCGTKLDVDNSHILEEKSRLTERLAELGVERMEFPFLIKKQEQLEREHQQRLDDKAEYEKYSNLYNSDIPSISLSEASLTNEQKLIQKDIDETKKQIKATTLHNTEATAHNAKVSGLASQIKDFEEELVTHIESLNFLVARSTNLAILVKSFSTTGLVAYKIECLIKDLEDLTNEYLAEMADGRFQLRFEISASDRLNVVIPDNADDVDIMALSTGERARVNISTLLAIRKLMQGMSNTKSNLLILDETVSNLDLEGKERLVQVLLNEPDLNTFLVSHDYEHPLIEKIYVIKENEISHLEK